MLRKQLKVPDDSTFIIYNRELGPSLSEVHEKGLITIADALKIGVELIDIIQNLNKSGYFVRFIKKEHLRFKNVGMDKSLGKNNILITNFENAEKIQKSSS